jgi:acetyl esterase
MSTNLLTYPRFLGIYLHLRMLDLTSRFPPLPGGVLDEQTALMRQAQKALGETFLDQVTPVQARLNFEASIRSLKSAGGLFEKVAAVRDLSIPGPAGAIPARLYSPGEDRAYPLFVLLHGGGWVLGSLASADNMARFLCKRVPCIVLSVDYRLAPEHPFPAAVEDAFAAVQWAASFAAELGGDPQRLLVGGDSAGGTLSAVVAHKARAAGGPRLAGQVLFYPAADCASLNTPSFKEFGDKSLGLPRRDVDWFLNQYVPDPAERRDPLVSPLLAHDFHLLPPALVVTAEFDVLRDEGEAYARCLEEAGVPVKLMRCNGMVHGFLSLMGLLHRATAYFDQVAEEIRNLAV